MSTKFIVTRTSCWQDKPCESAVKELRPYVDIRGVDSPEKLRYPQNPAQDWYARGTNHRLINGCIVRDLEPLEVWIIELASLEDLKKFCNIYGRVIINFPAEADPELEIYDDYRE